MSRLVAMLFERPFDLEPFVFATKPSFANRLSNWILQHPRLSYLYNIVVRQSPPPTFPPGAVRLLHILPLRRQALRVNGIEDQTRYALWSKVPHASDSHALRAMLHQVDSLRSCATSDHPGRFTRMFPIIDRGSLPDDH
jgi:hypothetical protein